MNKYSPIILMISLVICASCQMNTINTQCNKQRIWDDYEQWHPRFSRATKILDDIFKETSIYDEDDIKYRNNIIWSIAYLEDARLYIVFHDFLKSLPPERQRREIEEQRKWLYDRGLSKLEDAAGQDNLVAISAGEAFIKLTTNRITEISKRERITNKSLAGDALKAAPEK